MNEERIELCVPAEILHRVRKIAEVRGLSPEELIVRYIEMALGLRSSGETIIGLFADEPDVILQIAENAMKERELRNAVMMRGPIAD